MCAMPASYGKAFVRLPLPCLALLLLSSSPAILAFDKLTPAQQLIYERPHLANTAAGDQIQYRYESAAPGKAPVIDEVTVSITGAEKEDRRDVSIDFLSDERHLNLPDFPGNRGNPVIIAMFEHVARSLGEQTGGGTLYFRNRIRDSLAQPQIGIEQADVEFGRQTVATRQFEIKPFEGDSYLKGFPAIAASTFRLTFSDQVPGGLVGIEAGSQVEGEHAFSSTIEIAP